MMLRHAVLEVPRATGKTPSVYSKEPLFLPQMATNAPFYVAHCA